MPPVVASRRVIPVSSLVDVIDVVTNRDAVALGIRKLVPESGSLKRAFRQAGRPLIENALLRDAM